MSATRSPATPPASRTTPPPSPHTSQQELDLPASSPLRNTGDSSPLDLSPISSPEKSSRDPTKLLDHHHHDSPSPPGDLGNLASRTSADNIASLPAEIDSALRQVSTNNPNANNLHNTNPTLNINTTATTSNGLNPAADESSPMELVDEDIGAALELEGSDEYLGDDYMQDLRRVKVYELVDQNWKDLGTAFCSGEFDDQIREAQLIAKSEETQEVLLQITVRADEVYQRQADTLIVWTEPNGKDYALSFQDVEGCSEVWEFISEVRRHLRTAPEVDPASAFPDATVIQPRIPTPTLDNLAEIDLQIRSVHRASPIRDRVVENVLSLDLIRKLVKLMSDAEDLQSVKDLHQICSLMQAILLLNDSNIYEHILRDDVFIDMVGLMEYDPEFPDLKAHYRDFLQSNARHHQVIEFRDVGIQTKVHQTYRLQYLKDVVLARVLDDPIFNVLNSLVIFNQIEIVQYIQSEEYFLRELFSLFVQHPGTAPIPPLAAAAVQPTPLLEPTMATLSAGQNPSTPLSP
ncbi:Platinum sensitivity protein, partial [Serendipita sp. 405]